MQPKLFISILALLLVFPIVTFGQLSFDPEVYEITLEPDLTLEKTFTVTNDGETDIDFWISREVVAGEENHLIDPWTELFAENLQEGIGDDRIRGVAYIDGLFYFAGGNGGDDFTNYIYVFDPDGNLQDTYEQPDNGTANGLQDLAYGAGLLWGCGGDSRTIYGFDPATGEVVDENNVFNAGRNVSSITWDTDRGLLWVTHTGADLYAYDTDGDLIRTAQIPGHQIRGLGYYPEDEDNFQIYGFSDDVNIDGRREVLKFNIDQNDENYRDMIQVTTLDFEGDEDDTYKAKSLFITNEYDRHNWYFMTTLDISDWFVIWQLDSYKGWFIPSEWSGSIAAGESMDIDIAFDTWNLPDDEFAGEFVFNVEDQDGQAYSIVMNVSFERVATSRVLNMHAGWNAISLNVQPDEPGIEGMFGGLAEDGNLVLMKDDDGNFFAPMYDYNDIPDWDVQNGYVVKLNAPAMMEVFGESRRSIDTLSLDAGWQMISFYPRRPVEADIAFSSIERSITIVKDGWGGFYVPELGFNNMRPMEEGNGYSIKVTESVDLIYSLEIIEGGDQEEEGASLATRYTNVYETPGELPVHAITSENMSLIVDAKGLSGEIAVYANDRFVGSGVIENGRAGIAVWGDDPTTDEIDGAVEGDALELRLLQNGELTPIDMTVRSGEAVYTTNAFAVIGIEDVIAPVEYGLVSAYPNPFNSATKINFNLKEAANVNIAVFDISGRQVATVAEGNLSAGMHTATLDAVDMPSGIYIVRLNTGTTTSQMKISLIK